MLPAELDIAVYAEAYPDVSNLGAEDIKSHYRTIGIHEGRRSNEIMDRDHFASLASRTGSGTGNVLEIGPLDHPLLTGPRVIYTDYFSFEDLKKKAVSHNRSPDTVPCIKYVLGDMSLGDIPERFESVLSSHCIEHQADLILHLQHVAKILTDGGRYFLLVPDKRYCFDSYKNESTIGEIIDAYENKRTKHSLSSVIAHFASMSHNKHVEHWNSPTNEVPPIESHKILKALKIWRESNGQYVDVHGLYFTPESFSEIIRLLRELNYIDFDIERLYPTRFRKNEFWAILKSTRK